MNKSKPAKSKPYFKLSPRQTGAWAVPDSFCAAYHWPRGLGGGGVIAIVELGGGWVQSDMGTFFKSIAQPLPQLTDVSVDGAQNGHQSPKDDADGEVALDIQVAAAAYYAATGRPAVIRIYWPVPKTPAAWPPPSTRRPRTSAMFARSRGDSDEANWNLNTLQAMEAAAATATASGMVVFAAAGDNDSSDGGPAPANVDAPASCPHVIGCGGTNKTSTCETVWNDDPGETNGEGTGGGYSTVFPVQAFQAGAPNGPGRMVPDVAADADPRTGYRIFLYGAPAVVGGPAPSRRSTPACLLPSENISALSPPGFGPINSASTILHRAIMAPTAPDPVPTPVPGWDHLSARN